MAANGSDIAFDCQRADYPFPCYGPKQIQKSYRITPLLNQGTNGSGRTIVIVDAFQNPFATQELHDFDTTFGLPDPPRFDIVAPDGIPAWDVNDVNMIGWSGEISLDVQWAHTVAPGANLVLVEAKSDNDPDMISAVNYAVNHNLGDVISMSFGEAESCVKPRIAAQFHLAFALATAKGITLTSSSGDEGAAYFGCGLNDPFIKDVGSPAADPLVLGVGGTVLNADFTTGEYQSETAWSGSGGGFSKVYPRPDYQNGANPRAGRGVPDISYNGGDPNAFMVAWYPGCVDTFGCPGDGLFWEFFGTSAGSPQWAGLAAVTDQLAHKRVGFINDSLYRLAKTNQYSKDFHDITDGNNSFDSGNGVITGFNANKNWDAVTGLGSPIAANLIPDLAAATR